MVFKKSDGKVSPTVSQLQYDAAIPIGIQVKREQKQKMKNEKVVFLLALAAMLLGGCVYILGHVIAAQSSTLIKSGVHGRAVIESKSTFRTGGSGHPQTNYRLILIAPRPYQTRLNWDVNKQQWNRYKTNDIVDIFYAPSNIKNFIAGDENQAVQLHSRGLAAISIGFYIFLLGAFLAIAGMLLGYAQKSRRR